MSTDAASSPETFSRFEQLRFRHELIRAEGQTLFVLADRLRDKGCQAVQAMLACPGSIIDITDVVGQTRELTPAPAAESADPASWRMRTVRFPNL